jgi:hypothetical protein
MHDGWHVRGDEPKRHLAVEGIVDRFATHYLAGEAAEEGAVEGEEVQVVADHLDLDDDFVGLRDGGPGSREGSERGGVEDAKEAVEAQLGEADFGGSCQATAPWVTSVVSRAKVSLANWSR